jgi:hypothetical protein
MAVTSLVKYSKKSIKGKIVCNGIKETLMV